MTKKALVTGGSGVLGKYVARRFAAGFDVSAPGRSQLDLEKPDTLVAVLRELRPDVVVHAAALTNVDACETDPERAMRVNGEGTARLAELSKELGARMIYVSTAAVFPGTKESYDEDDETGPVNRYGASKLAGEEAVRGLLADYLIVRPAWLIGGGAAEKKFVSYIVGQARTQPVIQAVDDKVGTITSASELADLIYQGAQGMEPGTYHYGSKGAASRYEIAREIVRVIGASTEVVPVPSSTFETQFSAPRPGREVLSSLKLDFLHTWQESLDAYLSGELLSDLA